MSQDVVGSLTEEAAKLFAVVQSWTRPLSGAAAGDGGPTGGPQDEEDPAEVPLPGHNPRAASECRFCPLCTTMRLARAATPDVRAHVGSAVLSLSMAVTELLDNARNESSEPAGADGVDLPED